MLRPLIVFAALALSSTAAAQPTILSQKDATDQIRLEVGETRLLRISQKVIRVSVADPNVADIQVVTPKQVLVTGKAVGFTHLILWGGDDEPLVVAVSCTKNLNELRSQLKELFPQEQIKVNAAGDLVVLSGKVSDLRLPSRAAEVAKLHTERLANLVEVSGNQQVQLEVRFAEVSRDGMRKIGLTGNYADTAEGRVGTIFPPTNPQFTFPRGIPGTGGAGQPPLFPFPVQGGAFNFAFGGNFRDFPFSAVLSVLSEEGLAKMLAEPTIVALSGQEATFHAGGEVPILIAQQLGSVGVQFKKFGVLLKFTPTVLGEKSLNLKLFSEVSEIDVGAGVTIGGFQVPGFKVRNSETTIRLKDGQSFAIAGLLSDSMASSIQKVPLLGDIPILGALFRSKSFQRAESELLVVVSAHLVQPVRAEDYPELPGEYDLNDPDDFEFFLLGGNGDAKKERSDKQEEKREGAQVSSVGGPAGPVGFMR